MAEKKALWLRVFEHGKTRLIGPFPSEYLRRKARHEYKDQHPAARLRDAERVK